MEKIVTVTLNPAIDKSTTVSAIVPEKKLRCSSPKFEPGGGGVNVSRALKKLGCNSTAIYLAGGHTGKFFQQLLDKEGVHSMPVEINAYTRENLIVVDESSNAQYRFGMPGPEVKETEWKKCLEILETCTSVEYIVASGSVPKGVPLDFFGRLAARAKAMNAKLIIDTSGEALRHAVDEGVFMIKPNLGELSYLQGVEELGESDVVAAAKDIISKGGTEVAVISMGAAGGVLITKDEVLQSGAPTVKKRSTVGAGDSMVAGMVYALSKNMALQDVLKFGIAAGTATTMNPGTELFRKDDAERLFDCLQKGYNC